MSSLWETSRRGGAPSTVAPGRPKLFRPRAHHQHSFHSSPPRHAFNFEKNLLAPVSAESEVALVVGSSPSRAIARRAEVAPRYERAHARRRSPRVAPFAAPRTRPGDERVAASADARAKPRPSGIDPGDRDAPRFLCRAPRTPPANARARRWTPARDRSARARRD